MPDQDSSSKISAIYRRNSVLAILIPFIIGALIWVQFDRGSQKQKVGVEQSFLNTSDTLTTGISKLFFAYYHAVQLLATNPELLSSDSSKVQFILNESKSMIPIVDYIVLLDTKGSVIAHSNLNLNFKKLNKVPISTFDYIKNEDWFKSIADGKFTENLQKKIFNSYATKIGFDPAAEALYGEKRLGQFFATVIEDEYANPHGYLAMYFNSIWIQNELKHITSSLEAAGGLDVKATLLNNDLHIIGQFPPSESIKTKFPIQPINQQLEAKERGTLIQSFNQGNDKLFGFQPIQTQTFLEKALGWKVVIEADAANAFAGINWAQMIMNFVVMGAVLISSLLLLRISQVMRKLAIFNMELEDLVATRTKELQVRTTDMHSMLSNINQGIFTLEMDNIIHPEYSAYLEKILETDLIAGKDFSELVLARSQLTNDVRDQVEQSLKVSYLEDDMQFLVNYDHLIKECTYESPSGNLKVLDLDWNPILDKDDVVQKILVSVKDVTEMRALESEALQSRRQVTMISEIIGIEPKMFNNVMQSSKKLLRDALTTLQSTPVYDKKAVEDIFINVHTIKGNARGTGLSFLANAAHEAESVYSSLRKSGEGWDHSSLLGDLATINSTIESYADTSDFTLGRTRQGDLSQREIATIKNKLLMVKERLESNKPKDEFLPLIKDVITLVDPPLTLGGLINSNKSHLLEIAEKSGKECPHFDYVGPEVSLDPNIYEALQNILSHLITNAVDHGIESKEDRLAQGKSGQGTLEMSATLKNNMLHMVFEDDGKGLNLNYLRTLNTQLKDDELAEQIFQSGVTSSAEVSDLSGRGVGMGAIRQFLENIGGSITIEFTGKESAEGYRPFKFMMTLDLTAASLKKLSA